MSEEGSAPSQRGFVGGVVENEIYRDFVRAIGEIGYGGYIDYEFYVFTVRLLAGRA